MQTNVTVVGKRIKQRCVYRFFVFLWNEKNFHSYKHFDSLEKLWLSASATAAIF